MFVAPCAPAAHSGRNRVRGFLIAALVAIVASASPRPAAGWQAVLHQDFELAADRFVQGVVDRDGLVVLVSRHRPGIVGVRKVVATTGLVLWEREVAYANVTASAESTVATDPDGNLVLALVTDSGNFNQWDVAKLAGNDGRTLWRVQVLNPGNSDLFATVNAIAVDRAGDVVVAGTIDRGSDESRHDSNLVVVKLDGGTGAERWRREIDGVPAAIDPEDPPTFEPDGPHDVAFSVAIGSEGAVHVAGTVQLAGDACFAVIELDGKDGAERRRITIPGDGVARAVRVAENGDVVAVGEIRDAAVIARRREDGFWVSRNVLPPMAGKISARGLTLTPDGLAVVATRTSTVGFPARVDLVALTPGGLPAWESWRLDAPFEAEDVRHLAADGDGNVVVLGSDRPSIDAPGVPRMSIASVAALDGTVRWRRVFDGDAPNGAEGAVVLATPSAIVAAGAVFSAATSFDALAVGLAPDDGAERWRSVVGTPGSSGDIASAVACDAVGDVVAAGVLGYELGVVKLAGATGREQWRRTLGYGTGTGVAVASDGDVVAVGTQQSSFTTVGRFDGATGADRWRVQLAGYSSPPGLVLASDDDVVVTNVASVHRRSGADGSPRWRYDAPIVDANLTTAAIDPAGDVLAAGRAREARFGPFVLAVVKVAGADGAERWSRIVPATAGPGEQAFATALATDAAGDVFVTGGLSDAATGFNLFVLKLRGSDGATLWQRHLAVGTGNSLAITPAGDVVVGGEVDPDPAFPVATVFLLDGVSGAERWRRTIVGDAPARRHLWPSFRTFVALHPAGDVLAAAFVGDATTESDFAVVGLDPMGKERWRRTVDGTAREESLVDAYGDYTTAIAIDAAGNVAAAGVTVDEITNEDFTVLRLRGDGTDGPVGSVLRCQRAIASAGERLLRARLRFLARCHERGPRESVSSCADAAVTRLLSTLRSTIGRRCSNARLEALDACGGTVAEVAGGAGGEGCLVTANRAASDALFALLGDGADASTRCRAALTDALRRRAVWALLARQRCRETSCASAPAVPVWFAQNLERLSRVCKLPKDFAGSCATTAAGLGRCFASAGLSVVDTLVDAAYGPRRP